MPGTSLLCVHVKFGGLMSGWDQGVHREPGVCVKVAEFWWQVCVCVLLGLTAYVL